MPLPDTEIAKYDAFAMNVISYLQSTNLPPDTMLWHYTSGAGLLGILKSQSIFSTQVSCLNDSMEVRFSAKLIVDAMIRHRDAKQVTQERLQVLNAAIEVFQEDPAIPTNAALPYFVTCFSDLKDDLSQWRAYGGGENGYALGFLAKDLQGLPNAILARVTYYKADKHDVLADTVVEQMLQFAEQARACTPDPAWLTQFLAKWDEKITQVAPLFKDPGFAGESEYRLIKGYTPGHLSELQFVQKKNMLSMHLPLRPGTTPTDYRLPVSAVLVGPCRHRYVSKISVGTLLAQCGYDESIVEGSKSPFQET